MLGIEPPCLISLAKREEEIYRPGEAEPLRLSRHAAALRLLQYVRDEAHRFAQHYHHILRRKKLEDDCEWSCPCDILLTNDDGIYAPGLRALRARSCEARRGDRGRPGHGAERRRPFGHADRRR